MMLERTRANARRQSFGAHRVRTRSFHVWSGAALSRYFHKSDRPEPQPESSREHPQTESLSDDELTKRREQLQELLQQVNAERLKRTKKTG